MLSFLYFAPIFLTPGSLLPVALQLEEAQVDEAQVDEAQVDEPQVDEPPADEAQVEAPADDGTQAEAERTLPTVEEAEAGQWGDGPAPRAESDMAAQLAQRAQIRDVHRALGIATWFSMAGTLILGGMQLHDDYGPFASRPEDTPCTRGALGQPGGAYLQDFCFDAVPVPHLVSALVTSALYYTTFTLSFFMPDPLGAADSPGWGGERLRIHKTLRWLHLAGMVLSSVFGAVTANIPSTPDNFGERQALAITHFSLGLATYGLLTAAAAVMVF